MANAIISANAPELNVIDGLPVVSSLALADHFEKEHRGVLRDIRVICEELPEDLRAHNFVLSSYDGKTPNGGKRTYPMYLLTRDGFTLVAMGFTGKKALVWKVKYIQAFNAMEMELAKMTAPKRKSKALGRGIKALPPATQQALPTSKQPPYRSYAEVKSSLGGIQGAMMDAFFPLKKSLENINYRTHQTFNNPQRRDQIATETDIALKHLIRALSNASSAIEESVLSCNETLSGLIELAAVLENPQLASKPVRFGVQMF